MYLLKSKVSNYKIQYRLTTFFLLFLNIAFAIFLISFRTIDMKGGQIYGGIDAPAYKAIFELANTDYLTSLLVQFYEPGYASLVWFFSRFVGDYEFFQLFLYSFLYISLFFFVRNIKFSFHLIFTLLLLNAMIVSSLNILRITVAVFASFYVFSFINQQKYFRSLLVAFLSITIHTSSVILLPIIFMCFVFDRYSRRIYFTMQFLLFILFCFFSFYILPVLLSGSRLDEYSNFNEGAFSFNTFIIATIVIFLTFNRYEQFLSYNPYNKALITTLPTIFIVMPIFYNYSIGYRFLMFYLPVVFALLPSIFYVYRFKLKSNLIFYPLIIFLYCYVFIRFFKFFTSELKYSEIYELQMLTIL